MRRHKHKQNVRDYSQGEVTQAVSMKMAARVKLLAPEPVKPHEVYKYCWTKEERLAIRTLKDRLPSLLRKDDDMTLIWDTRHFVVTTTVAPPMCATHLYVKFANSMPLPCTDQWSDKKDKLGFSRLPEPMLDTIEEWAVRFIKLRVEADAVVEKATAVFSHCNTMGQVHRLWPNLCSFLPERGQAIVRNIKVRSRLPEAVLHYADDDEENKRPLLDLDWRPEALQPYDDLITEALLLPDLDAGTVAGDWKVIARHGPAPLLG